MRKNTVRSVAVSRKDQPRYLILGYGRTGAEAAMRALGFSKNQLPSKEERKNVVAGNEGACDDLYWIKTPAVQSGKLWWPNPKLGGRGMTGSRDMLAYAEFAILVDQEDNRLQVCKNRGDRELPPMHTLIGLPVFGL